MRLELNGQSFDLSGARVYWWCGQNMVWDDGQMPRDCSPEEPHSPESGWCGWALVIPGVEKQND